MPDQLYAQVQATARFIRSEIDIPFSLSLTFGTGFNQLISRLPITHSIPYEDIPHMPISTVPSHQSHLYIVKWHGKNVLIWGGRFHYYEGYDMRQVSFPNRVAWALGVKDQLFTNASGSVNRNWNTGDLVTVRDHINFMPENPLRGIDEPRFGDRFPDMTFVYEPQWRKDWLAIAEASDIPLNEGVYLGLSGPNLETPAEYRMFNTWGADIIGMSTVPEVIVAQSLGCRIGVISIISNLFDIEAKTYQKTSVDEIIKVVNKSSSRVFQLLDIWMRDSYKPKINQTN